MAHCEKIKKACSSYGVPCFLRVTSAHKGPDETLRIKGEYEGVDFFVIAHLTQLDIIRPIVIFIFLFTSGDSVPTVFVAVAGRSNGLGPVMSGNTAYPVINCPPLTPDWGAQDVWSSLRMPSGELRLFSPSLPCVFLLFNMHCRDRAAFPLAGLGCSTILSPDAAAQFAAQIFGLNDHLVWAKLRASMLNTWTSLKLADQKLQACSL